MKALKRGIKWGAYKFVPRAFNILVIFGLVFQPVGTPGIWNIALAQSADPALPIVEEAAPTVESVKEDTAAPVKEEVVVTSLQEEAAMEEEPVAVVVPEITPPVEEPVPAEESVPIVTPEPEVILPVAEETPTEIPTEIPIETVGEIPEILVVTEEKISETTPTETALAETLATDPAEATISQGNTETPADTTPVVPVEEW
jgi:hypothetical protein